MKADRAPMSATRRTIFAGAAALPAMVAASPLAARITLTTRDADFIRAMEILHPNGGMAAKRALAIGMRPEWLWNVLMASCGASVPALLFKTDMGVNLTVRPNGVGPMSASRRSILVGTVALAAVASLPAEAEARHVRGVVRLRAADRMAASQRPRGGNAGL